MNENTLITIAPNYGDEQLAYLNPFCFKQTASIIADCTNFVTFDNKHVSNTVVLFSILNALYINDVGIYNICFSFPNLISLSIHNSMSITNKSLNLISTNLKKLKYLQVSSCKNVKSKNRPNIKNPLQYLLKKLKRLNISENDHLDDELFLSTFVRVKTPYGYRKPKQTISNLEHINFSSLIKVHRTTWHYLFSKPFVNIVSLTLAKTFIGDEALLAFSKISRPLIHIDLSACPNISDVGLRPLIQKSKNLLTLKLNETNLDSIDIILYAIKCCQEITQIEAKNIVLPHDHDHLVYDVINHLCTCAPRLKQIDLDMFLAPANKMLLLSKMKSMMNVVQNKYTNIAYQLSPPCISQSSYNVDKSRNGKLAVDGIMSSKFGEAWCDHSATTTMTGLDVEAFIELDLGRTHDVREVYVKLPDDRHGTRAQFPIYVFTSLRPFKRKCTDILRMDYLVSANLFEQPTIGLKVSINAEIRYVRVQHVGVNGITQQRCLSVAQIIVRRRFLFLAYVTENLKIED
jgi:hypothetical protein